MTTKSGRFKLMRERTDAELDQTIENAVGIGKVIGERCGLLVNPFWELTAGVDAYFEKRRRKLESEK